MPKKVGRRIATSAYLDPSVFEALNTLSQRLGIPVAELVRQAIDDLLLRYRVRPKSTRTAQ